MQIICVCKKKAVPLQAENGKLSEWSKEPHSKCGIRASVSRVRIPHFPQIKERFVCLSLLKQANRSFICKDAVGRLRDYVEIIVRGKAEIRNPPLSGLLHLYFFSFCRNHNPSESSFIKVIFHCFLRLTLTMNNKHFSYLFNILTASKVLYHLLIITMS